ncbi:PAS domain S-box protein [Wenzhouxiangella sp. XN201]|uniref:sensor domain-containing protein n=1 Tax=Wenzhouxiangella sp. XN201 TaxID=2710755 RepID=UPI0013CDCD1D|nr:sensor domain-containing diguanylate cyclase [Wenzhouxiangella sp. XN201]NEZ04927.1 PAS domain S-box protein [Wenzhouxiangella sp. XN201]
MPDQIHKKNNRSKSPQAACDSRQLETEPDFNFRLFVDGLSDLVCLHEPDGAYVWVSPSVRRILGYEPSDLIGRDPYDLFHPEDAVRIRESTHDPALSGQGHIFVRYRIRHRDGHYVWLESLTQPHLDDDGNVFRLQTSSRDISEQKRIEQALRESEERYRAVINSLAEGVLVHGSDGRITACNPSACQILGVAEEHLIGVELSDALWNAVDEHGREIPRDRHPTTITLESGEACRDVVMGLKLPNTRDRVWIAINTQPFDRSDAHVVVASFRDITAWRETRRELDLLAKVFEASSEAILITDANRNVIALNHSFTQLTGYTLEDLQGKSSALLRAGDEPPEFYEAIWESLETRGFWRGETWNRGKNGNEYPVWLSFTAVRNDEGDITHYISICTDITEQHTRREQQQFLATHDPLTGLANRTVAYDRIEMEIRRCQRNSHSFAVLFVDLDGFKSINDRHGHRVGDILLRKVARRIQKRVRASDTVSRLGGDEFIVVLTDITHIQDAHKIARTLVKRLAEPYRISDLELTIGASIGISKFPELGTEAETLIHAADLAMYDAKATPERAVAIAPYG